MKSSFVRLLVITCTALNIADPAAAQDLLVDFNSTTQGGGPNPQAGYQSYDAGHEVIADFIPRDYAAFGTTITLTPHWPDTVDNRVQQMIDRDAGNDANWTGSDIDLVTDFLGIDTRTGSGGLGNYDGVNGVPTRMTLTLDGLPAGDYGWTSFHHDTENVHTPFQIEVSTDGGGSFSAPTDHKMSSSSPGGDPPNPALETGPDPASLGSTVEMKIAANGADAVVIRFIPLSAIAVHNQIFGINGFGLRPLDVVLEVPAGLDEFHTPADPDPETGTWVQINEIPAMPPQIPNPIPVNQRLVMQGLNSELVRALPQYQDTNVDTIVRRLQSATTAGKGDSDTVDTEIVALALESVECIRVQTEFGEIDAIIQVFAGELMRNHPDDFISENIPEQAPRGTSTLTFFQEDATGGNIESNLAVNSLVVVRFCPPDLAPLAFFQRSDVFQAGGRWRGLRRGGWRLPFFDDFDRDFPSEFKIVTKLKAPVMPTQEQAMLAAHGVEIGVRVMVVLNENVNVPEPPGGGEFMFDTSADNGDELHWRHRVGPAAGGRPATDSLWRFSSRAPLGDGFVAGDQWPPVNKTDPLFDLGLVEVDHDSLATGDVALGFFRADPADFARIEKELDPAGVDLHGLDFSFDVEAFISDPRGGPAASRITARVFAGSGEGSAREILGKRSGWFINRAAANLFGVAGNAIVIPDGLGIHNFRIDGNAACQCGINIAAFDDTINPITDKFWIRFEIEQDEVYPGSPVSISGGIGLAIDNVGLLPAIPITHFETDANGGHTLEWLGTDGLLFDLEFSDDLRNFSSTGLALPSGTGILSVSIPPPGAAATRRFYRIVGRIPPDC